MLFCQSWFHLDNKDVYSTNHDANFVVPGKRYDIQRVAEFCVGATVCVVQKGTQFTDGRHVIKENCHYLKTEHYKFSFVLTTK